MGRVELNVTELLNLAGSPQLKDVNNFRDEIISGLEGLKTTLQKELKSLKTSEIDNWAKKPHNNYYL